jgi:hypothetical protein
MRKFYKVLIYMTVLISMPAISVDVTNRTLSGDGDQVYSQDKGVEDAKYLLQKQRLILLIPSSPPIEWQYQILSKEYARYGIEWRLVGDAPSSGYVEYCDAFNKAMSDSIVSKYGQDFFDTTEREIKLKTEKEDRRRNTSGAVSAHVNASSTLPKDAQELIAKVHQAAKIKDVTFLGKNMTSDFGWSFGDDDGLQQALNHWKEKPDQFKHLWDVTGKKCGFKSNDLIQCPMDAGMGYRAGFEKTDVGWKMSYFVAGD